MAEINRQLLLPAWLRRKTR